MALHLNMSDAGGGFEPLDIGSYLVRVDVVTEEVGNDSGKPYLKWVLEVTEDPNIGRKLFLNTSLIESALWKLYQTLEAFGFSKEDMDTEDFELETEDLLDLEGIAVVTQKEYNNVVRNNVEKILPLRDSSVEGSDVQIDF